MMRKRCIWFTVCVLFVAMLSCSNQKSYTDRLKDEEKAIERLIKEEKLEILKEFPKDYKFKENQFVKLENDVYINVVDSGNGERAEKGKTVILSRFTANQLLSDGAAIGSNYGPHSNGIVPIEFKYGYTTHLGSIYLLIEEWLAARLSEGMQTGLEYVGNRGKVKLIVPFKRGSASDQQSYDPVYFEILEYKFLD